MDLAESAATPLSHPMLRPAAPSTSVIPSGSGSMDSESLQTHGADDWCMHAPDMNEDGLSGLLPPLGGSPTVQHAPTPETGLDNAHTVFDDLFTGEHPTSLNLLLCIPCVHASVGCVEVAAHCGQPCTQFSVTCCAVLVPQCPYFPCF